MSKKQHEPKPGFIYALLDSRERIRFVGQQSTEPSRASVIRPGSPIPRWVQKWCNRRKTEKVELRILEECEDMDDRERHWVHKLEGEGMSLLNVFRPGERTTGARLMVQAIKRTLRSWNHARTPPDAEDVMALHEELSKHSEWRSRKRFERLQRRRAAKLATRQVDQSLPVGAIAADGISDPGS